MFEPKMSRVGIENFTILAIVFKRQKNHFGYSFQKTKKKNIILHAGLHD